MTAPPQIAVFIREGVSYNLNILLGTVECRRGRPPWNYRFVYHGDISVSELETGPRVAGVIAQLQYFPELVPVVERRGIPTVDVSPEPSAWKFPQVLPDDVEVGRRAGEFFVGRGFKHFAFLGYDSRYSALRQRGFESVVRRTGGSFASIEEPFSYLYDLTWLQRLRRWLKSLPKPVALMSATDLRSRQLLLACEKSNIRVPEEISVISVDDDESICQLMVPTLSSIPLDGRRAGYETAALLDRMMSGETVPWQSVPIPPLLIRHRRSSDAYAISDEEVSAALRFIWENGGRNISVENVADAAGISRRSLQVRFREVLGRTMQSEIWRCHLDRAKEMLTRSNLPLWQVAERSGFPEPQAMSRMFFRETGMTPRAYRQSFHA